MVLPKVAPFSLLQVAISRKGHPSTCPGGHSSCVDQVAANRCRRPQLARVCLRVPGLVTQHGAHTTQGQECLIRGSADYLDTRARIPGLDEGSVGVRRPEQAARQHECLHPTLGQALQCLVTADGAVAAGRRSISYFGEQRLFLFALGFLGELERPLNNR